MESCVEARLWRRLTEASRDNAGRGRRDPFGGDVRHRIGPFRLK